MFNGNTHYKWPFSIAMLVYQRVMLDIFLTWAVFKLTDSQEFPAHNIGSKEVWFLGGTPKSYNLKGVSIKNELF